MKRLLIALLLLPCIGHAQGWRVGLSAGVSAITKPRQSPPPYTNSKLMPGGVGMLSISRKITERLELGLDIAAVNLVRRGDLVLGPSPNPFGTAANARLHIGKLVLMITPSMSYKLGNYYIGPQVGYFITMKGSEEPKVIGNHYHAYYNEVRGLVAGAHLGRRHSLSKQLSLQGELRANYLRGNQIMNGVSFYGFNMMQVQLTVGANYAF